MSVTVIGAGLAGCEAAWQLATRGVQVNLVEMKPKSLTKAHNLPTFAELVCSNSLKSKEITSSNGLLKAEMSLLNSFIIEIAKQCALPSGGALAVDGKEFSKIITQKISSHNNIRIIEQEATHLGNEPTILATGPLTSPRLAQELSELCGNFLYFYDASSPIVCTDSLDFEHCFYGSRYNKGGDDYINCPLTRDEYVHFVAQLASAERVVLRDFEKNIFEGCLPVEVMASRGEDCLRFSNLKPVGFIDPKTGKRPYALVQLRREDKEGRLYNLVGFQTNLKFGEQKRVFSLIPALKKSEFSRFGVMHRNTFLNAPAVLDEFSRLKQKPNIFVAGQLSGVEGYVESAVSGLFCALNAYSQLRGEALRIFPKNTMAGALFAALGENEKGFQPICTSFGLLPPLENTPRDKKLKKQMLAQRALSAMEEFLI